MSLRSRLFKQTQRRHARYVALRDRIIANQRGITPEEVVQAILDSKAAAEVMVSCDPDRYIRRWLANHPRPLPDGIGDAYHRRHR